MKRSSITTAFLLIILTATIFLPLSSEGAITKTSQIGTKLFFGRQHSRYLHVAEYFGLSCVTSKNDFVLKKNNITVASFKPDSRSATINGVPVILNYAPTIQGGLSYIATSDLTDTLQPLFQSSSLIKHTPTHVVIDPGHGGKDPGAIGKVSKEKEVTLAIAKELKKSLESRGFRVSMTRTGDSTLSLEDRANFCTRVGGQIFISIHADAAASTARGTGTFSLTPLNAPSYNTSKVEGSKAKGHFWCDNSLYLSYAVQRQLGLNIKDTPNRGIKRARFSVLRNTNCPAILIETGFISNQLEEKNLNSPTYWKRLAESIATGVVAYKARVKSK